MKKFLLSLALMTLTANPIFAATDIIINSTQLKYSNDYKEIELKSPIVNIKSSVGDTKMNTISVDKFVTFWDSEEKTSDFNKDQPNAILSSWDSENNYLESTFIIRTARKTPQGLALGVEYLENSKEGISPISINSKPVELKDLQKFINDSDTAAVTVLVDCAWFGDGRC